MSKGTLTILESETGSGKTEAAIGMFLSLKAKGLVDSCYVALPTRTSAVQIHKRVQDAVNRAFVDPPPVAMAVPGYLTAGVEGDEAGIHRFDDFWSKEERHPRNWHTENPKRYLSALVSVGTIDQLLLSVLNVKHSTLRWSSFSRSLIVIDEVHASDTYMSRLLEELLARHLSRGGHALLMSATLGAVAASRFLECVKGHQPSAVKIPAFGTASTLSYPLIRRAQEGRTSETKVEPIGRRKTVRVQTVPAIDDAAQVADLAAHHAQAGAKVLVIRNTVRACVDTLKELERRLPVEMLLRAGEQEVVVPHHGRFAPPDRKVIDQAIEQSFGKASPDRALVAVGTQTIEQSLDIDCDILITDICPMDVLLQRIGRLHRHTKKRIEGYEEAKALVLLPHHPLSKYTDRAGNGIGDNRAYENVAVCELTRQQLESRDGITIPDDNRLLVEAATHPEQMEELAKEQAIYRPHIDQNIGVSAATRTIANSVMRKASWRYGDGNDDPENIIKIASTRLGDKGFSVPVDNARTFLGFSLRALTIPAWMLSKVEISMLDSPTEDPVVCVSDGSSVSFSIGERRFSYSRFGLERLDD